MTREDYEELKRLRELGCEFVIAFKGFPMPYGITEAKDLIIAKLKLGWIPSGYREHIPTAIADYEREHKEDIECWPDWKKRAALCNYEFGKED